VIRVFCAANHAALVVDLTIANLVKPKVVAFVLPLPDLPSNAVTIFSPLEGATICCD